MAIPATPAAPDATDATDAPVSPDALAPIEFHFDFISPFGWFASQRIEALAARHGRRVDWHAMLLGVSVMKVMGLKPLLETPLKGDYTKRDIARHARLHGLPLARALDAPVPDPLPAARSFWWAKATAPGSEVALAKGIYSAMWTEAADIGAPAVLEPLVRAGGLDAQRWRGGVADGSAASLLRAAVERSLAAGVFGSPFFIVEGEPFWGVDKLELLDRWLQTGGW
jgi:2-hydroxychromene-2-carboxylate isomerase